MLIAHLDANNREKQPKFVQLLKTITMSNSKFYIIPGNRYVSSGIKESGSSFLCPSNTVMTGRYHTGDENGRTQYEYASLKAVDEYGNPAAGIITVENVRWETSVKESSGNGFDAPYGRVIVGRKHSGDENGQTQYATALIKIDGKPTVLEEGITSLSIKESSGIWFKTDADRIMTGRHHSGDENGKTYYTAAKVVVVNSSTESAPSGTIIVPNVRAISATMKESNSFFICPPGTVMTGRSHIGDENGDTQYEYSTLKAVNSDGEIVIGNITVEDVRWDDAFEESSGKGYDAPANRVLVGRAHTGDENDDSRYATAIIKFNGNLTGVRNYAASECRKESGGWNWYKTSEKQILTGRHHFGDENGNTYYCTGTVFCDVTPKPQNKFNVIVGFHIDEKYFPMNPMDFITLSRFRRHNEGSTDDGYNKNTNGFVNGNNHGNEYYNIPVSIINSFYVKNDSEHILYNLRPRDKNSIGKDEVFLQPDNHLNGNLNPNEVVPVFTHSSFYRNISSDKIKERREFWIFYGYDDVDTGIFRLSHQGDWERITLDLIDEKIVGAWLDQHGNSKYYPADALEITETNGIQTLRVYSARGLHSTYERVGKFSRPLGSAHDFTNDEGYQWEVTRNMKELRLQPWKLYAGAWGEVGMDVDPASTGPLGAWYKTWDFGTQDDKFVLISSLIVQNQLLIQPDVRYESDGQRENDSLFETPENMLITGRNHCGDENGITQYECATLKAVNYMGKKIEGTITVTDRQWSEWQKESDSANFFHTPTNRVITGRQHSGDENGKTRYQTAKVLFNGNLATVSPAPASLPKVKIPESFGVFFKSASKFVLTGRTHSGDENGETTYYQGYISINV